MKAVVTGASGLVGSNLVIELLSRGNQVVATRRAGSRIEHLADREIEWAVADLGDAKALARAFEGADTVFHCAAQVSIRKKVTPDILASNVEGTRNVIQAARAARVGRLLHCSTVNAVGLTEDGTPCTEQSRWNFPEHGMDDAYTVTKRQAEDALVKEGGALDWVIVNPSFMIGPFDTKPSSGKLVVDIVRRKIPGYLPGYNNFVDVRDVVRGMVTAAEKGRRGERYILSGENLSYTDLIGRVARAAGVLPPARELPRLVARMVGLAGDVEEMLFNREPLLNSTTVRFGFCTRFQFSCAKAERELDYRHGPIETAIADAIAYFRKTGTL